MKLKNKKTGEIGYTAVLRSKAIVVMDENAIQLGSYTSLAELNAEWEDYEEPKEYWCIDTYTYEIDYLDEGKNEDRDNFNKQIGNYFETREEAEEAVRKLKAWKRLEDKGFRFSGFGIGFNDPYLTILLVRDWGKFIPKEMCEDEDLKLLFGADNE